jgi:hypothetical protein
MTGSGVVIPLAFVQMPLLQIAPQWSCLDSLILLTAQSGKYFLLTDDQDVKVTS